MNNARCYIWWMNHWFYPNLTSLTARDILHNCAKSFRAKQVHTGANRFGLNKVEAPQQPFFFFSFWLLGFRKNDPALSVWSTSPSPSPVFLRLLSFKHVHLRSLGDTFLCLQWYSCCYYSYSMLFLVHPVSTLFLSCLHLSGHWYSPALWDDWRENWPHRLQ